MLKVLRRRKAAGVVSLDHWLLAEKQLTDSHIAMVRGLSCRRRRVHGCMLCVGRRGPKVPKAEGAISDEYELDRHRRRIYHGCMQGFK